MWTGVTICYCSKMPKKQPKPAAIACISQHHANQSSVCDVPHESWLLYCLVQQVTHLLCPGEAPRPDWQRLPCLHRRASTTCRFETASKCEASAINPPHDHCTHATQFHVVPSLLCRSHNKTSPAPSALPRPGAKAARHRNGGGWGTSCMPLQGSGTRALPLYLQATQSRPTLKLSRLSVHNLIYAHPRGTRLNGTGPRVLTPLPLKPRSSGNGVLQVYDRRILAGLLVLTSIALSLAPI